MENPFKNLFGNLFGNSKPQSAPPIAGAPNMVYHQDTSGNHFYLLDSEYTKSKFLDLQMDTLAGKAQALRIVTPFAAMVDRMSKLFAFGVDYVPLRRF